MEETGAATGIGPGTASGARGAIVVGNVLLRNAAVELNLLILSIRHGGRTRNTGSDRTGSYGVNL